MHGAEIADLEGHSLTGERVERRLAAVLAADVAVYSRRQQLIHISIPIIDRRGLAVEGRATALAEIDYSDATFAHPEIIGVNDVGERHTDRCEEDFRLAFFVSTGCRNYSF